MKHKLTSLFIILFGLIAFAQEKKNSISPNENLIVENIPEISKDLALKVKKYSEGRGASLVAIHPVENEIIIATRFGLTNQLHKVTKPLGSRKQFTFFDEPLSNGQYEPTQGKCLIFSKDIGGNEFGQLYKLDLKTLQSTLLTDGGRSQNGGVVWKKDGSGFFFTSTKRNGGDRDIYYMNPNNPKNVQLVLEVKGGGWGILDISKDGNELLISEYISANESFIWHLDLTSNKL